MGKRQKKIQKRIEARKAHVPTGKNGYQVPGSQNRKK